MEARKKGGRKAGWGAGLEEGWNKVKQWVIVKAYC